MPLAAMLEHYAHHRGKPIQLIGRIAYSLAVVGYHKFLPALNCFSLSSRQVEMRTVSQIVKQPFIL